MSTHEWLGAFKILGSITAVWFALIGWKLLPLIRHPAAGE